MAGVQHRRWAVADRPWAGHHALNGKTWMAGTSLDHDVEDRDVQCAFSLFADDEAFRRTAALMAFPHPDISGLHRSGRAPGIEQGTGVATAGELVLDRCEKRSIARKLEHQSLIVFERFSDEFG